ncbi:hypothetical protein CR513_36386 [Mucuna pruriens]|uniref:Uncharacterized protein n=1 Tax=Mucuna pruriens TaxID=157652 RepID=A0A371FWQ6_MUCPR|nr:hypothetical protein CR513_36386 [Mucuna pruriens]
MTKTPLMLFFLLINILMFSASGRTSTTKIEDLGTSRRQKETKSMYGMIMESSKLNTQRTNLRLHAVQHTNVSQKSKTNGGANNVKNHKGKNSASTYSIKSSSLFIPVMLLVHYPRTPAQQSPEGEEPLASERKHLGPISQHTPRGPSHRRDSQDSYELVTRRLGGCLPGKSPPNQPPQRINTPNNLSPGVNPKKNTLFTSNYQLPTCALLDENSGTHRGVTVKLFLTPQD